MRLHFLDGIRGLASLYVVLFHEATAKVVVPPKLSPVLHFVHAWCGLGHFSVVVFIVLSGFSLMLPISRSGETRLVGGFSRYLRRRARRILPPYYAALVLSAGLIVAANGASSRFGGKRIDAAALSMGSLVSHVFLFQNARFDWVYRINGPMWSVSTEWQLYFVFALGLLPLFRFAGPIPTVIVGWIVGSLPFFLLPPDSNFFWACPWFMGAFALGMLGASLGFSPARSAFHTSPSALWDWVTAGTVAFLLIALVSRRADTWPLPFIDLIVSLATFSGINACVERSLRGEAPSSPAIRLLGSAPLRSLAGFSYSLYLIQHPLIRLFERVLERLHIGSNASFLLLLMCGTPMVMLAAWVFSLGFERPFTRSA